MLPDSLLECMGTTTTVDSGQVAKYAIGGGLSDGVASPQEFYLSLAKQATPVVEVGAAKEIAVIISEGKELDSAEICLFEWTPIASKPQLSFRWYRKNTFRQNRSVSSVLTMQPSSTDEAAWCNLLPVHSFVSSNSVCS